MLSQDSSVGTLKMLSQDSIVGTLKTLSIKMQMCWDLSVSNPMQAKVQFFLSLLVVADAPILCEMMKTENNKSQFIKTRKRLYTQKSLATRDVF